MSDNARTFLAFVTGAVIGSLVTWKIVERKYKQIADDEIESVKEVYNRKLNAIDCAQKDGDLKNEHENLVKDLGYTNGTEKKNEKEEDMVEDAKIYVIPPESFGEADYETESLTYYADKVLYNESTRKIIKNVDEIVGRNSLETFGEYEDDSVFVRNDILKRDYEILLDMRNFEDSVVIKPHYVTDDE